MRKTLIGIFLFLTTFIFGKENNNIVNNAVEQINFLYSRNNRINNESSIDKKWYIYFLESDKDALQQFLIGGDNSVKTFSSGYLDYLNDLLIEFNKSSEAAMYVALTDYTEPITVPILPSGKSLTEKINSLRDKMDPNHPEYINATKDFDYSQLKGGIKDYENFKTFFSKKAVEIYKQSVLSKVSGNKRIIMPLSVFHYVTIGNKKKRYYTLAVKSSNIDPEADKEIQKIKNTLVGFKGRTGSEQKVERIVKAFKKYYSGDYSPAISGGLTVDISKDSEIYNRAHGNQGYTPDNTLDLSKHLLDFAGILSEQDKQELFKNIDFSRTLFQNMTMSVLLTDSSTPNDIINNIKTLKPTNQQYFLWVNVGKDGTVSVNNITPDSFDTKIAYALSHWTTKMWAEAELNLGSGTVKSLKSTLAFSHQILKYASDILQKGFVPEKYWNPKHKEYPSYMPHVAKAFNASMGDFGSILDTNVAQMQFAFKTGIWNGVLDEVTGLVETGKLATEYFLDPEKASKFDQGLSQLSVGSVWKSFRESHGYEDGKETNHFVLSHQLGKDAVAVASMFIGIGEIHALATTGKLAKVSTLTKNVAKLSKVVQGGAIKILKKIPKETAELLKKLPKTITKEVQLISAKAYLVLKLNSTKLAKVSDDGIFIIDNLIEAPKEIIEDIGEVSFKEGVEGLLQEADIALVKNTDGEIGLGYNHVGSLGRNLLNETREDLIALKKKFNPKNKSFNCVKCAIDFQREISETIYPLGRKIPEHSIHPDKVLEIFHEVFGVDNVKYMGRTTSASSLMESLDGLDSKSVILIGELEDHKADFAFHAFNARKKADNSWEVIDVQSGVEYSQEFIDKTFSHIKTYDIRYINPKKLILDKFSKEIPVGSKLASAVDRISIEVLQKMDELLPEKLRTFIDDFKNNDVFIDHFNEDPLLLEVWEHFEKSPSFPEHLRTDIKTLKNAKPIALKCKI